MKSKTFALIALITFNLQSAIADDEADVLPLDDGSRIPSSVTSPGTGHLKYNLDLTESKKKSKSHLKVTLRKIDTRVRVEVEGFGLSRGKYAVFSARSCSTMKAGKTFSKERYQSLGYELHRFSTDSGNIYTEQSQKNLTMNESKSDKNLSGRAIVLVQLKAGEVKSLGCKTETTSDESSSDSPISVGATEAVEE